MAQDDEPNKHMSKMVEEELKKRSEAQEEELPALLLPAVADSADMGNVNKKVIYAYQDSLQKVADKSDSLEKVIEMMAVEQDSIKESLGITESEANGQVDTIAFKKRATEIKVPSPKKISRQQKSEEEWQKTFRLSDVNAYKVKHELDSNYTVFGWHPYWMGNAYKSYNFSLLSTISYFSYELEPNTGDPVTVHDWKTTSLIDSAKVHGCEVLLSVTNFGERKNNLFLKNKQAQKKLIDNLQSLLNERGAHGVNIDFENVPSYRKAEFRTFLIDLTQSLRQANAKYKVSLTLPAKDFDAIYDITELNNYIDLFIIMGYDFYGKYSSVAGPVSLASSGDIWWEYNLEGSISEYEVAGVPKNKMIMGLPYYGAEWQTTDLTIPSKAERFINYLTYKNIRDRFQNLECCEDQNSGSKYHVYRDAQDNYRQIWYEDTLTLGKKYDMIKNHELGGVAIWALGYDNGYDDLWKLLAKKFKKPEVGGGDEPNNNRFWAKVKSFAMRFARNPARAFKSMLKRPQTSIVLLATLLGLGTGGFMAIVRLGCKMSRMQKLSVQGLVAILFVAFIVLLFYIAKVTEFSEIIYLFGGLFLGIILFFIFSRRFLIERDLP